MADLLSGVGGFIDGLSHMLGQNVIGILMVIWLPSITVFTILTAGVVFFLLFRRHVFVLPWQWKYTPTDITPFADGSIGIFPDKGALCKEDNITRFKLKNQNSIMQKMDTVDIYPNGEIPVISLGPNKRSFGKRIIDWQNRIIYFDIENPKVAIRHNIDAIKANDPNWLMDNVAAVSMYGFFWLMSMIIMISSSLLVVYPIFWSIVINRTTG
jgi:hypothetical protein